MEGDRRSRILGGMSADARNVTIALVSTVVFFTVLGLVITNSPGWPEVKTAFFNPTVFREVVPGGPPRLLAQHQDLLRGGGVHPRVRPGDRRTPQPPGPGLLPDPCTRDRLHRLLPGNPDDPPDLHPRLRRAGARARWRPHLGARLGDGGAHHHLLRLRRRGVSRGDRVCAPEPGRRGPLARAHPGTVASPRRRPAGGAPRRPAAPERLHRAAEGHCARRAHRPGRGLSPGADRHLCDLQLHALRRGGADLRRLHDPAGAADRLAQRAQPPPAPRGRDRASERFLLPRPRGRAQVVRQARGAEGHRPLRRRARGRLPHRRVRLGEVHTPALHQPDRADRRGQDLRPGRGDDAPRASTSTRSGAGSGSSSSPSTSFRT